MALLFWCLVRKDFYAKRKLRPKKMLANQVRVSAYCRILMHNLCVISVNNDPQISAWCKGRPQKRFIRALNGRFNIYTFFRPVKKILCSLNVLRLCELTAEMKKNLFH